MLLPKTVFHLKGYTTVVRDLRLKSLDGKCNMLSLQPRVANLKTNGNRTLNNDVDNIV